MITNVKFSWKRFPGLVRQDHQITTILVILVLTAMRALKMKTELPFAGKSQAFSRLLAYDCVEVPCIGFAALQHTINLTWKEDAELLVNAFGSVRDQKLPVVNDDQALFRDAHLPVCQKLLAHQTNVNVEFAAERGPDRPPKKGGIPKPADDWKDVISKSHCYVANTNSIVESRHHATVVASPTVKPSALLLNYNHRFAGDTCETDYTSTAIEQSDNKKSTIPLKLEASFIAESQATGKLTSDHGAVCGTVTNPTTSKGEFRSKPQIWVTKDLKLQAPSASKKLNASKECYAVLVGNTVKECNTKFYASLPLQSKYMVKERMMDTFGKVRAKMVIKTSLDHESCKEAKTKQFSYFGDDTETDGENYSKHFRRNCNKSGYIIYSSDRNFHGNMMYPLPTGKAANCKIGKGGNGLVFIMYHEKKEYAVKKTVYRPNEVNIHSALKHENILPLLAVLMGEKHEKHSGKFYCYHLMPKMDYDFRRVLSVKEAGCLKYLYRNCSTNHAKFERAFNNVKHILRKTLKALEYIHSKGYVHRDVKASNIMIRMSCQCNPLYCNCTSKFQVKLVDFDSAGTVPGLHIKEPTDQMIKFASILPLGTPGYRAPEVSMHIVLSGPYETLYTTAVDMWSFGCLCLNICIGKTAALRQREEASLLLSTTHQCSKELWRKTTKIHELEITRPFSDDVQLLSLVKSCLQVDSKKRLSAVEAQKHLS